MYSQSRSQGFGKEVKRRILLGTYALSSGYYDAYYKKAQQVRSLIRKEFAGLFSKYDLVLSPVAPTTAWKLGRRARTPWRCTWRTSTPCPSTSPEFPP